MFPFLLCLGITKLVSQLMSISNAATVSAELFASAADLIPGFNNTFCIWCLTDTRVSVQIYLTCKAIWKEEAVENYRLLGLVFCSTLIKCRLFYFPVKMGHEPCWAAVVLVGMMSFPSQKP